MSKFNLTPFDRLVWLVLAALWLATGLLIVRGDRVGVQVTAVSPADGADACLQPGAHPRHLRPAHRAVGRAALADRRSAGQRHGPVGG